MPSPQVLVADARQRVPFLDHVVRTVQRYLADGGNALAASVTYYWFLSLFPILLLAVSLLGFVYGDQSTAKVQEALGGVLPRQAVQTIGTTLQEARGPAGVLGIAGLLYSGLGWIDALREAVRTVWHQNLSAGNIVVRKLRDVGVLVGLYGTVAASVVFSGGMTAATAQVLDRLGLSTGPAAEALTLLLVYALAIVGDTALFLYLFARLPRAQHPWRRLLRGAVFGAVGFEVLKVLGGLYIARTTTTGAATYGTFAVVVGLLLFLNLVSRLLLLTAAFVVTAPYDSDAPPSGTSSREMARRAGIPEEFADSGPDDPPTLRKDGAPTPLVLALRAPVPLADGAEDPAGRQPAARTETADRGRPPVDADARLRGAGADPQRPSASSDVVQAEPPLPGEQAALRTARAVQAVVGVAVAGVAWHALQTAARVLRR